MKGYVTTEQQLALSVQQYRDILHHAENLMVNTSTSNYGALESYAKQLNDLQATARENDRKLLPSLISEPLKWQDNAFFLERQELIQEVIEINKKMMPSLQAAVAVAANDMNRLHAGRTAVAGYTAGMTNSRMIKSTV